MADFQKQKVQWFPGHMAKTRRQIKEMLPLVDCYVAAACFKKVYDPALFEPYICDCSGDYFERLLYKPYYLRRKHNDTKA
jgi:hypothetical protein